jgi:hypothetical protein
MSRALSVTLVLLTTATLVMPGSGCSKKSDSQPNPEFKAPAIPAGRGPGEGAPGGKGAPKT